MKMRSTLVAGLVLALFALSACSSDEGGDGSETGGGDTGGTEATTVSNDTYVTGLCTTMGDYVTDVQTITEDFSSSLDPAASIEDQKDAVLTYLDDVIAATETMISDVQAIGVPEVDNGQEVVSAVQDSFAAAKSVLEDARSTVDGLSTDDPVAFGTALVDLGTSLQTSLGDVSGSLEALNSQALSDAAAAAPECAQFASAVGTT